MNVKKKLLGIIVCTLLTTTALPAIGTLNEKTTTSIVGIESIPIIDFRNPPIINFRTIPLVLLNYGEGTAEDIIWEMEIIEGEGLFQGKLLNPKKENGSHPLIGPYGDFATDINLRGLGITTINFIVSYTMEDVPGCNQVFQVKQEWRDIGVLSLHLFPEIIQPSKEWVDISNVSYYEDTDDLGVWFYHSGLLNMHNVRVVPNSNSAYSDELFLAACKFTNGTATLKECWLTKDIVEGGDAHWEVETVDGE